MALEISDGDFYQKILIYVILTVIFIRLFVSLYQWLKPRAMAWFLTKFAHSSNEAVGQIKSNVFASMKQIQKENGELVVLEIGAGTGANFNFFPESSKVGYNMKILKLDVRPRPFPDVRSRHWQRVYYNLL